MNSKKLSNFYKIIEVEKDSNDIQQFITELKNYLTIFLSDIKFFESDCINCIQGSYKKTGFIIDLSNGIELTITDSKNVELLEMFKPLFTKISGRSLTCSYEKCSSDNEKVYPTLEWCSYPSTRLRELSNTDNIKNLNDYYTEKIVEIIESLGQQLMSNDGFELLFENSDLQDSDETYKFIQIQKMYPNIRTSILQSWTSSSRNQLVKRAG